MARATVEERLDVIIEEVYRMTKRSEVSRECYKCDEHLHFLWSETVLNYYAELKRLYWIKTRVIDDDEFQKFLDDLEAKIKV